jgi:sigma-B regulation protein RsbU (phosphoserine phosphatase)
MGRDLVRADRCSIWLVDAASKQLVTRLAQGAGVIRVAFGEGLVGRCIATGETVISNSVETDNGFAFIVDDQTGYRTRSVMVVPMKSTDGKIMGAFQALNKIEGFTQVDADLLALAAAYSASTIEGQELMHRAEAARRMERELEIAREVQQRLLPSGDPPRIAGVDFAAFCRPASEVGGDYYTFVPLPGGQLLVALGDISGKGIGAALMMASVQASLHAHVLQRNLQPAELAVRLNNSVYESSTASRYSTLFLGIYDPTNGTLASANAGHCSPMLLRGDGTIEKLDASGPPIGLLATAAYSPQESALAPGDCLICYSDGFSECENAAEEMWSDEDFESVVRGAAGFTSSGLINHVLGAADRFAAGAVQRDDMTIFCLRATGI